MPAVRPAWQSKYRALHEVLVNGTTTSKDGEQVTRDCRPGVCPGGEGAPLRGCCQSTLRGGRPPSRRLWARL